MDHSCILCGVLLHPYDGCGRPSQRLRWDSEVRAGKSKIENLDKMAVMNQIIANKSQVRSSGGRNSPSLSGVGFLRDSIFIASNNAASSYARSHHDLEPQGLGYIHLGNTWGFAFHEACWQILFSRVTSQTEHRPDMHSVAEKLFDLLYCLPCDSRQEPFASHDFGGAANCWDAAVYPPESWGFLLADPMVLPLLSLASSESPEDLQIQADSANDPFDQLPREVVYQVTLFLETSDVCNLRLASRAISNRTGPYDLPESFWTSLFDPNLGTGLSAFANDGILTASEPKGGHRGLYGTVRQAIRDRSQNGHMRNRRRIWQCVGRLAECLVPMLNQCPCLLDKPALEEELSGKGYKAGQTARGIARQDRPEFVGLGHRTFGKQCLYFDLADSKPNATFEFRVSLIHFDCRTYICGLRVLRQNSYFLRSELSRVGLIIPSSEVRIPVGQQHQFLELRVACAVSGIVGLGFTFQDLDGIKHFKAAGTIVDIPSDVGVLHLTCKQDQQLGGILVGLDVSFFTFRWL